METFQSGKRVIGLGGGIGAGKSVIARILRLNSIPVYDCDSEAKRLMQFENSLKKRIIEILGEESYSMETGVLNKKHIASRIFSNETERKLVNQAVHLAVAYDFIKFCATSDSKIVVCESAILKSSGLYEVCNEIWITDAPDSIRISRVKRRNGLSENEILNRIRAQECENTIDDSKKIRIIHNDGNSPMLTYVLRLVRENKPDNYNNTFEFNQTIL